MLFFALHFFSFFFSTFNSFSSVVMEIWPHGMIKPLLNCCKEKIDTDIDLWRDLDWSILDYTWCLKIDKQESIRLRLHSLLNRSLILENNPKEKFKNNIEDSVKWNYNLNLKIYFHKTELSIWFLNFYLKWGLNLKIYLIVSLAWNHFVLIKIINDIRIENILWNKIIRLFDKLYYLN